MSKKKEKSDGKKPITKRLWFWPVVAIIAISAVFGGNEGRKDDTRQISNEPDQSVTQVDTSDDSNSAEAVEPQGDGTYTLPCGMKFQFWGEVRNDTTGRWRRAVTSDSFAPADYAVEYYNTMFYSDDELHSIWNATLKTTTSISVSNNLLFVDTYEYVKGEEHDAKIMFSGQKLDSRIIDKETGEPLNIGDEEQDNQELGQNEPQEKNEPDDQAANSEAVAQIDPEPIIDQEPKPNVTAKQETAIETQKPKSRTVYKTPTGKRYHYDGNCNGGTYIETTLDDAISLGLTPCKKCVG